MGSNVPPMTPSRRPTRQPDGRSRPVQRKLSRFAATPSRLFFRYELEHAIRDENLVATQGAHLGQLPLHAFLAEPLLELHNPARIVEVRLGHPPLDVPPNDPEPLPFAIDHEAWSPRPQDDER